jgi:hypothetical protein
MAIDGAVDKTPILLLPPSPPPAGAAGQSPGGAGGGGLPFPARQEGFRGDFFLAAVLDRPAAVWLSGLIPVSR